MGDTHAAARAASSLGLTLWRLNRSDEALATLRPAFEALAGEEHDVDVGRLAPDSPGSSISPGSRRARDYIELALDVAEAHHDMAVLSEALNTKSLLLPNSACTSGMRSCARRCGSPKSTT